MRVFPAVVGAIALLCNAIGIGAQEVQKSDPNYINLAAEVVDPNGMVRLTYSCDYSVYNYGGRPVDMYLLALCDPRVADTPASVSDALASGAVQLFAPNMAFAHSLTGDNIVPTFKNLVLPPTPVAGDLLIDTVAKQVYPRTLAFAALLAYADTGALVRTDGLAVEVSNTVTPFRYHVAMLPGTIHVGDGYDPYMATWEVTHPEGITVRRTFVLETAPTGMVMVRGAFWGTYYADNPVGINDRLIGYLPAQLNGNNWSWLSGRVPPSFFHEGANTAIFRCAVHRGTGHWDNYMAKGWELYFN